MFPRSDSGGGAVIVARTEGLRKRWRDWLAGTREWPTVIAHAELPAQLPGTVPAQPVVLILELAPGDGGLDHGIAALLKAVPDLRILALLSSWERELVLTAARLGARGIAPAALPRDGFFSAVRSVVDGQYAMSPEALTWLLHEVRRLSQGESNDGRLTARERDVMAFLARGLTDKEIANELGVALGTVHSHLKHIFSKLGARTRTEAAVRYGRAAGDKR
jgi:DNA-binding NarL/FixJ family response regulator